MYKKNPLAHFDSNEKKEHNLNEREKVYQRSVRVNRYMNSSNLKNYIAQPLHDTTSDITCNRKKEENDYLIKNILNQGISINPGKKQYKRNKFHLFEGKTGYYL